VWWCRLDAIGAIGIARCFTFGGKFPRPLYDPAVQPRNNLTKAAYMDSSQKPTTINHFYEKLLKLQVPCSGLLANLCQASIFRQDVLECVCQTL